MLISKSRPALAGLLLCSALFAAVPASAIDPIETLTGSLAIDVVDPGVDPNSPAVVDAFAQADALAEVQRRQLPADRVVANGEITVTYLGDVPPDVQTVIDAAAQVWSDALVLSPSAPLEVEFQWLALPSGILGRAGAVKLYRFPGFWPTDNVYPAGLANVFEGADIDPDGPEITMQLSSTFGSQWFIDTTGQPSGSQFDLFTVAIHEFGHGLGFFGSAVQPVPTSPPNVQYDPTPFVYDSFVERPDGVRLFDLGATGAASLLQSNSLYFDIGAEKRLPIYAPTLFKPGSSYNHFDEGIHVTEPGAVMTPNLARGEVHRSIDGAVLGLFEQTDWGIVPPPITPDISQIGSTGSDSLLVQFSEDLGEYGTPAWSYLLTASRNGVVETETTVTAGAGGSNEVAVGGLLAGQTYTVSVTPLGRDGRPGLPATGSAATQSGGSDVVPPVVVFPNPVVSSDSPMTVGGTVSDVGSGVDRVEVIAVDIGAAGASGVPLSALRWWDGEAWGSVRTTLLAELDGGEWSFTWDPVPGGSGSYAIGLVAYDVAGNKWPADKDFQAILVISDSSRPSVSAGVSVGGGGLLYEGSASDDVAVRKVRMIVRHVESNTYWDGSDWVAGSAPGVLLTAELSAPLVGDPSWSFGFSPGRSGTFQALAWAQNGAYQYSLPEQTVIVIPPA